jgi:hypothetical protein
MRATQLLPIALRCADAKGHFGRTNPNEVELIPQPCRSPTLWKLPAGTNVLE